MNKNIGIIIGIIAIVGVAYLTWDMGNTDPVETNTESVQNTISNTENSSNTESNSNMESVSSTPQPDQETSEIVETSQKGSYEAYSADKIARAETGTVVLFFHAAWCPSCRGLNSNIESNINSIPADVTILKTDYDTQTELRQKYGVTTQHTLVQVDKDGNLIKKWSGGSTLDSILSQIN
jgi:thioredoxin-like negative regulator of GroEL